MADQHTRRNTHIESLKCRHFWIGDEPPYCQRDAAGFLFTGGDRYTPRCADHTYEREFDVLPSMSGTGLLAVSTEDHPLPVDGYGKQPLETA